MSPPPPVRFSLPEVPGDDPSAALARLPELPAGEGWPRRFLDAGMAIVREVHRSGGSGRTVVRMRTALIDRLVTGLADRVGLPEDVALVAQGGYGRRELAPGSDVDLLLLAGRGGPELDRVLYTLWDLGLKIGHAVRSIAATLRFAAEDHVTLTALLDARLVRGPPDALARLSEGLAELLRRHGGRFIAEKRAERDDRRRRFGDSVYLLEPDVKQCEGGLRDLQTALWIAAVRYKVRGLRELLASSILPPSRVAEALRARDFLWRLRNEMHLQAGRGDDHLTFERQLGVAPALGYRDEPEGLAVERLMRHYYLAAAAVKGISDAIVERCAQAPTTRRPAEESVDEEFNLWGGALTVTRRDLLETDPTAIPRAFLTAARRGVPLYGWTRDLVVAALPRVDDAVRSDPRAVKAWVDLLTLPDTDGGFLVPMHELGVLGAFFPEFDRVTALTQHDVWHAYTVDVHSLFALRRLYALRRGELVREEPELTRIALSAGPSLALCLAVLFHDAGKGLGGSHAAHGARIVETVARRLRLPERQIETAAFLVREHLSLSHVAQRRDLSDPELLRAFAAQVGSVRRLDRLYLLTYVDVASVGPGAWNDWKARLFAALYSAARALLAHETAEPSQGRPPDSLPRSLAAAGLSAEAARAFLAEMPERYLRSVEPAAAARHIRLLRRLEPERPLVARRLREGPATEVILSARDRPGLLALFAGALAAHGIAILAAEVFSTRSGAALDVFHVQTARGGPVESRRWRAAREDLRRVLSGEESPQALLARRVRPSLLARRLPAVEPKLRIDNDAARDATVLDVTAEDRLGLLFTLARALFDLGLTISLAKVTTEANRAIDSFYVTAAGRKVIDPAEGLRIERALIEAIS